MFRHHDRLKVLITMVQNLCAQTHAYQSLMHKDIKKDGS